MTMHLAGIADVIRKDPRYPYEAYEFVFAALHHTQKMLDRIPPAEGGIPSERHHVSGGELLQGIRDLALREFGLMARTVFHLWGIDKTDDFGEIVFNLVEAKLMSKTEDDVREDFREVYDLDEALCKGYSITLDEAESV
jgi:uncharacterized repeat protein (TIGR04138 family)